MDDILNKIKTVSIDMSTCDEDANYNEEKLENKSIPKLPSNRFYLRIGIVNFVQIFMICTKIRSL